MRWLFIWMYLSTATLKPGMVVYDNISGKPGRIIRVEPTEVLVKSDGKRLYWSKYQLKEFQ